MADEPLGRAILELGADRAPLDAAMAEAHGDIKAFAERAAAAAGDVQAFAASAAGIESIGDAAAETAGDLTQTASASDAMQGALLAVSNALLDAAVALEAVAVGSHGATAGADQTGDALADVAEEAAQAGDAVDRAGDELAETGDQGEGAAEKLSKFGLAMLGIRETANLIGRITGPLQQFFSDAIGGASDLGESINKTIVVFGDGADAILAWSQDAAHAFGLSVAEAQEAAGNFGAMFQGAGASAQEASEWTKALVERAADLASIYNTDVWTAIEKIRSGLTGQAMPLRDLNIFLTEAEVAAKALAMGLGDAHGELSEGAKLQARYALIMEQSALAADDFSNNADALANAQRILQAQMKNLSTELGEGLLPFIEAAVNAGSKLADRFMGLPDPIKRTVAVVGALTLAIGLLIPAVGTLMLVSAPISGTVMLVIGAIAGLIAIVGVLIANWDSLTAKFPALQAGLDKVKGAFSFLWEAIKNGAPVAQEIVAGFVRSVLAYFRTIVETADAMGRGLFHLFTGQWHKLGDDFRNAKNAITNGLQDIADGVGRVVTAYQHWGEESEKATEKAAKMEDLGDEIARRFQPYIDALHESTEALYDWAGTQSMVDSVTKQAGESIDTWTKRQKEATRALEILEAKRESGVALSLEEQKQYDSLIWYVGRLQAGIEDDLNPAYVAAQAAAANLMRQQDELQQALADGTITQEEFNKASAEVNAELAKQLDPNNKLIEAQDRLADALDKVVEKFDGLLRALGIIPPETPVRVTDDGTLTDVQRRLLEMNGVIIETPGEVKVEATAETVDAQQALENLRDLAVDQQFTVTAHADISAVRQAVHDIDRLLPHSPAEEGPLSREPNWDWLFAGIERSAGSRTGEALDHLKKFVDTARTLWAAFREQIAFSREAQDAPDLPGDEYITSLKFAGEHAIESMGDTAALYEGEYVDAAKRLGDAVRSVYGGFSSQVSFAREYAESVDAVDRFTEQSTDVQARLKFAAEHAVQSMADSAAVLEADAPEQAARLADATRGVYGALGAALGFAVDAARAVADDAGLLEHDTEAAVDRMAGLTRHGYDALRAAAEGLPEETQAERDAAEALARPWKILDGALSFARAAAEAVAARLNLDDARIGDLVPRLVRLARDTSDALRRQAADLAKDDLVDQATAEALTRPLKVVGDALDILGKLTDYAGRGVRLARPERLVADLLGLIRLVVDGFRQSAAEMGGEGLEAAAELADMAGTVFGALTPIAEGIAAVRGGHRLTQRALATFEGNVAAVLDLVSRLRAGAEARLDDALAFQATMEAIAAGLEAGARALGSAGELSGMKLPSMRSLERALELATGTLAPSLSLAPAVSAAEPDVRAAVRAELAGMTAPRTFNIDIGGERFATLVLDVLSGELIRVEGAA